MKKNLVSIVIPVYNAENYLEKLFKDILEQTYSSLEIIIIDDGSEDNSWEIIQKYADQDDRIRSVRTSNKGPSSARNTGLDMVQGEYIRFIDADDEITKDSIELMVGVLKKNDYTDLVIGNYQCMPEHNYFKGDEFSDIILCQNDFAKYFVRNMKSFYYGVTWNKLYRTEIVKKYNIRFNEQIDWCEDLCFNIDYYEKCRNIHLFSIEGGIYTYCSRESSVTNCLNLRRKEELLNIDDICYQKAAKYFKTFGLEKLMQLEWKYSNLYYKLSELAGEDIASKQNYYKFKNYLKQKDVQAYIEYKKSDSKLWLFLRYVNKKNIQIIAYILFILKNVLVEKFGKLLPNLKNFLQKLLPKAL